MKIQIDQHTLERAEERGTSADELNNGSKMELKFPRAAREKEKPKFTILNKSDLENTTNTNALKLFMLKKKM